MFGFSRADLSAKLLQMLKYGNFISPEVSNSTSPMFGYSAVTLGQFSYLWNQAVNVSDCKFNLTIKSEATNITRGPEPDQRTIIVCDAIGSVK